MLRHVCSLANIPRNDGNCNESTCLGIFLHKAFAGSEREFSLFQTPQHPAKREEVSMGIFSKWSRVFATVLVAFALLIGGCASTTEGQLRVFGSTVGGAVVGAAAGAAVGSLSGDAGKGAVIGGAAGGLLGWSSQQSAETERQRRAQFAWLMEQERLERERGVSRCHVTRIVRDGKVFTEEVCEGEREFSGYPSGSSSLTTSYGRW